MTMKKIFTGLALIAALGGCNEDSTHNVSSINLQVPATDFKGSAIAAADMDNDGDIDILATDGNGQVFLYTNTGDSYSQSIKPLLSVPAITWRGSAIAAADWDNDGDIDILTTDTDGNVSLYKNKGNNQF